MTESEYVKYSKELVCAMLEGNSIKGPLEPAQVAKLGTDVLNEIIKQMRLWRQSDE